jgi:peptidoglycan/LPS O-acetylase OafA/YrhL
MNTAVLASTSIQHHPDDAVQLPAFSVYLDCVRAMAAFLVVAGHARMLFFGDHTKVGMIPTGLVGATSGPSIPGLGSQAVIVFFVLSGFLVGGSAWRAVASERWSWKSYLSKRLIRLWIVLIPALVVGGCLDTVGRTFLGDIYSGPAGQHMVSHDLVKQSTLAVLADNAIYLQGIAVPSFGTNSALWSLANEFWYYMAFPLLLLTFFARSSWKRLAYGLLSVGILIFVGKTIAELFVVWLMGAAVARSPLKLPLNFKRVATLLSCIQFLGVTLLLRIRPFYPIRGELIMGVSFSLLLYTLLHMRQPVRSLMFQRIGNTMASFSYSLYLFHLPMLVFLTGLVNSRWQPWPIDGPHVTSATLLVVLTYCYAYCCFWLFERKTDQLRRWLLEVLDLQQSRLAAYGARHPVLVIRKVVGSPRRISLL